MTRSGGKPRRQALSYLGPLQVAGLRTIPHNQPHQQQGTNAKLALMSGILVACSITPTWPGSTSAHEKVVLFKIGGPMQIARFMARNPELLACSYGSSYHLLPTALAGRNRGFKFLGAFS